MDLEALKHRLIQLTRDLVLIESTDARPEERRRCFQLIRNHLEEVPGIVLTMHQSEGYESLVALPDGVSEAEVLLCGHLDVVEHPEPDSYRSEVRDGRIYGPGAGDMKGQLAILLELLRQLQQERPGLSVGLAITSDEERGGEHGVRFLVDDVGLRCGAAIIPDGGSLTDVTVEEKGILHLRVRANGHSAHAARPWLGDNPLEHLMTGLGNLRRIFDEMIPASLDADDQTTHWFPTCSVTIMETPNDSPNRIPDVASAVLDVRFPPPHSVASMTEFVAQSMGNGLQVETIVSAEPTHLAPDPAFVDVVSAVTGEPAELVNASGGSDGRFFSAHDIPVILSRPLVGNLHGRDEWIEIDSMGSYFEICRRYILARCS